MAGGRRMGMSDVILGVWNGYMVLLILLATPIPVVADVEVKDAYFQR